MFDIFGILATPLGYAMKFLYDIVGNYGWAIVIFTILVRIVLFPLAIKQQKSTARMQAYQPMIQEIQKKWASDKQRQQQEVQKFYQENNIKMSVGCLPMLVNMLVLFGMIAVIQAPLNHVLHLEASEINLGYTIMQTDNRDSGIENSGSAYHRESMLIGAIRNENTRALYENGIEVPVYNELPVLLAEGEQIKEFKEGDKTVFKVVDKDGNPVRMTVEKDGEQVEEDKVVTYEHRKLGKETIDKIAGFNFNFLGLNMADAPRFSAEYWYTLIMPVLSLLTMVASQIIIMKTSGQTQNRGQMLIMTVLFGALFAFYAFRVPTGFSLYYTMSNIIMTVQQLVVRRIHDPKKITEEILAEMEAKKAAKKAKKKVVLRDDSGNIIDRELNEAELAKLRLAKARELDAKRYGGEDDGGEADKRAERARELDEERYGEADGPANGGPADEVAPDAETPPAETDGGDEAAAEKAYSLEDSDAQQAYKPGRRKRARQKKEDGESFAEAEQAAEDKAEAADKEDK